MVDMTATGGAIREIQLADGSRARVRPLHAEDEDLLRSALAEMSERSLYLRFLSPLKRLPGDIAHHLAAVDGEARFALCALSGRPERIVGVARYDRLPGSDIAEVAVAVIDSRQRQGIGSQLLAMLAGVARDHGINTFTLVVLPENQGMLRLLRRLGWIHQARLQGGLYEITFALTSVA